MVGKKRQAERNRLGKHWKSRVLGGVRQGVGSLNKCHQVRTERRKVK